MIEISFNILVHFFIAVIAILMYILSLIFKDRNKKLMFKFMAMFFLIILATQTIIPIEICIEDPNSTLGYVCQPKIIEAPWYVYFGLAAALFIDIVYDTMNWIEDNIESRF